MTVINLGKEDRIHEHKKAFEGLEGVTILEGELLEKMQRVLLEMLKEIVDVCEKNDIFYTMGGGSVLGTVRHHGFIPWDDDIDLNMPRKDFEKFKAIFDAELGEKYVLCTPEKTPGHGMSASQIKKKGTKYKSFNELSKQDSGICIDIFVIENTFDNAILRNVHGIACLGVGYMLTCRKTLQDMPYLEKYLKQSTQLAGMFVKKAKVGKFIRWIPLDTLAKTTMKCYSACKNHHSKYISVPSGKKHYFGEMYPREDMCESVFGTFGDLQVRIPKETDKYMRILYGDSYMELPSEEKREHHPIMELDFGEEEK